jgi:hypothetical protein
MRVAMWDDANDDTIFFREEKGADLIPPQRVPGNISNIEVCTADIERGWRRSASGAPVTKEAPVSNSAATRAAVVSLAREHTALAMHPDEWDADPWLLGTPGGVLDLRTGQLRVPRPEDYICMITAVAPGGDCPIWKKTLAEIFGTEEMVKYHQRVAGYCATGSVREEKLFFFAGTGRNGKGTFIETILYSLGDYGTTVAMSTLMKNAVSRAPDGNRQALSKTARRVFRAIREWCLEYRAHQEPDRRRQVDGAVYALGLLRLRSHAQAGGIEQCDAELWAGRYGDRRTDTEDRIQAAVPQRECG